MQGKVVINNARKDWISSLAESIAGKFFATNTPITPEIIAHRYGITYNYGEYGDFFDGMLVHNNGFFHIHINTQKHNNTNRHRFSFAHELGHYFIDEHAIALSQNLNAGHCSISGFISDKEIEREADLFAASLLMPETRTKQFYRKYRKFDFGIIESLSKSYQVSITAALYRVFYLDLHPMMIVKVIDGKIAGWPLRSKDFYFWIKDKSLPEDSGAYHFFKERKQIKTSELYAFDWFNTDSQKRIYEHCLFLESLNTVICVIWYD